MKREEKHRFLFFNMYHPWIIFFCFFIVQNTMCTKLSEKSISSQSGTEDGFFTAIKQRETLSSESYLMPHHLYYLAPREANQKLNLRYIAVESRKNNEKDSDHLIKYFHQFQPNLLKSSNISTSKIQVTEFKPYSESNYTKNFQQNFKSSVMTPTFLGNQEKFLQYKEVLQPSAFHVFIAPQQKKFVSNLIKVNRNNELQTSNLYFHNFPTKNAERNEHEEATAVYRAHNLEDLTSSKNDEFTFENPKESQSIEQKKLPRLKVPQENEIRFMVNVPPLPIKNQWGNLLSDVENNNESNKSSSENKNPQFDVFLSILQETKNLPKNFTSDNLSSGIKTLALILQRLQEEKKTGDSRSQQTSFAKSTPKTTSEKMTSDAENYRKTENFPQLSETSTPGKPGTDYPIYASIPNTKFDCSSQRYKGFFADPDTNCQVWHYCDLNGGQASFLCPNGTIFSQAALTCDWWFNVKCSSTSQLYVLNERLYKYILPFSPSFPEDYSGPIVDKYLMAKFKEKQTN